MAGFFENVLGGAGNVAAYDKTKDELTASQGDMNTALDQIYADAQANTQFNPVGVTSGVGTNAFDANGNMTQQLGGQWQGFQDQALGNAGGAYDASQGMLGQVSGFDQAAREKEIYDRQIAMMQPGWDRDNAQMNERLLRQGRSGMATEQYGGTPEQFAMQKAQAEAQNAAAFGAMGQAQSELTNYGNMANMFSGMGNAAGVGAMTPWEQMNQQGQLGNQMTNTQSTSNNQMAQILAELGLGQATNNMNFGNIQAGLTGNLYNSAAGMLGGIGGSMDAGGNSLLGGLGDTIAGWF